MSSLTTDGIGIVEWLPRSSFLHWAHIGFYITSVHWSWFCLLGIVSLRKEQTRWHSEGSCEDICSDEGKFNISPMSLDKLIPARRSGLGMSTGRSTFRHKAEAGFWGWESNLKNILEFYFHGYVSTGYRFPHKYVFKRTLLQPPLWNHCP